MSSCWNILTNPFVCHLFLAVCCGCFRVGPNQNRTQPTLGDLKWDVHHLCLVATSHKVVPFKLKKKRRRLYCACYSDESLFPYVLGVNVQIVYIWRHKLRLRVFELVWNIKVFGCTTMYHRAVEAHSPKHKLHLKQNWTWQIHKRQTRTDVTTRGKSSSGLWLALHSSPKKVHLTKNSDALWWSAHWAGWWHIVAMVCENTATWSAASLTW